MEKFNLNKMVVLSLGASLLLAACGTMDDTNNDTTPTEPDTEQTTDPTEGEDTGMEDTGADSGEQTGDAGSGTGQNTGNGIQDREFEITLDEAVQIFFDTFPDAEGIDYVEFDIDDGRFEYEIDGFNATTEFELTVDAETGETYDQSEENDDDSKTAIDFDAIISPQEAMANALDEVGSGYIKEWDLETDDGQTVYEIDVENATTHADDVYVDAVTGDVRLDN